MKRLPALLFVVAALLTSCTKVIYPHSAVMAHFKTKADLINRFGLPTQVREGEGIAEWMYDYGTISTATSLGNSQTQASVSTYGNTTYGNANTNGLRVTQFSNYNRYLLFTLDGSGNVTKWNSEGVDFSIKKTQVGKTILWTTLTLGAIVGLAAASSGAGGY